MQNRNNLSVRLIKRPRGAPGPRKQISVHFELSVREVAPDRRPSEPIHKKRSFPEFSRSLLIAIRYDEGRVEKGGEGGSSLRNGQAAPASARLI